jgi:hypothetical protein
MYGEYSRCPRCEAVGWHRSASRAFNSGGQLWGVCDFHGVRWYITREMMGESEEPAGPGSGLDLPVVKGILTHVNPVPKI